jgi:AraC family transcriptional activator of pyochelin receptor
LDYFLNPGFIIFILQTLFVKESDSPQISFPVAVFIFFCGIIIYESRIKMLFELLSDENRELVYSLEPPISQNKFLVPGSEKLSVTGSFGGMLFQQITGDDFQIHYSNYLIKERSSFRARSAFSLVELQFCLIREVQYRLAPLGQLGMHRYHYNITYVPYTENQVEFKEKRYATFDIHYSMEFLRRISPEFPELARFIEKIDRQQAAQIAGVSPLASTEMLLLIAKLLNPDPYEIIGKHYLESIVKELLFQALQRLHEDKPPGVIRFTDYEIDCIREARKLLLGRMDDPITILELSQKVGINDYKLKKGYRQVFGTSLYAEFREERMKIAARMLKDPALSVAEIAFSIGYKNISNFSIAFRKRFGCTPTHWRKSP